VRASRPKISPLLTISAALGLLYVFRTVLWPLALALVLTILIGAVTRRIQRALPWAGRRTISLVAALFIGGLVLGAMLVVVAGVNQIVAEAGTIYRRLNEMLGGIHWPGVGPLTLDGLVRRMDVGAALGMAGASFQAASAGLSLTALYLIFIVAGGRGLEMRLTKIAASRSSDALITVLTRSVQGVEAYTYIQTITGLMIAVGAFFVMTVVGLKSALFWSLVLFLFTYLPVIGVVLGSIGPTLFALVQFPTLAPALLVLCGIQAISFIVGNLVLPKMQADSQNIDPAASLLAIGVWTILWGLPGAFLGIPLTLALMYALAQYKSVEWIAILISNDGDPLPPTPSGSRT
jgi:AI-2 transport protein TqsA